MGKIRAAVVGDFPAICDLVTNPEESYWVYPRGHYPWTPQQIHKLAAERKELTVIEQNGNVIAFANLYDLKPDRYAFIGNVIIESRFRNQGFGREIIQYMIAIAIKKYQLKELRISVFSENVQALLLYADMGFNPYHVEERRNLHGKRVALIHMAGTNGMNLQNQMERGTRHQ